MSRAADYTIKGFLYQINRTILEILQASDDATITVEGLIEDIDTSCGSGITATHVKYHEAQEAFTLSLIYKPLLQMMKHHCDNKEAQIKYKIYAYFPNQNPGSKYTITEEELGLVLKTTNKGLQSLVASVTSLIDASAFLANLSIEFGREFDELVADVVACLTQQGLDAEHVDTLFFPNALQYVALLSIEHDHENRKVKKSALLKHLKGIHSVALSRWTLALKTSKAILTARRGQLRQSLQLNQRQRHFYLSSSCIEDFDVYIVTFLRDYLQKYHCKKLHTETPLFCLECTLEMFNDIRWRLHENGVRATDGQIAGRLDLQYLFRKPLCISKVPAGREFQIRLLHAEGDVTSIKEKTCNDFFVAADSIPDKLDADDVNIEHLAISTFPQLRYVLGISDAWN